MRTLSRLLALGVAVLCISSTASVALARVPGRGFGARGGAGAGDICNSWGTFNVSLSTIDVMITLNDAQKAQATDLLDWPGL